jgi:hypothetical protein
MTPRNKINFGSPDNNPGLPILEWKPKVETHRIRPSV